MDEGLDLGASMPRCDADGRFVSHAGLASEVLAICDMFMVIDLVYSYNADEYSEYKSARGVVIYGSSRYIPHSSVILINLILDISPYTQSISLEFRDSSDREDQLIMATQSIDTRPIMAGFLPDHDDGGSDSRRYCGAILHLPYR